MSKSALTVISSTSYLSQVWDSMYQATPKKKRDRTNSLDKVTANEFNENKKHKLRELSRAIRNGTYIPDNLKAHFIPKLESNKDRVICVPTVRDRLVQRAVLTFLNNNGYTLNNSVSYGFIKGPENGLREALNRALELRKINRWCYKADISSFFDRLDRKLLVNEVKRKVKLTSLQNLICSFIHCEIEPRTLEEKIKIRNNRIVRGVGLRQGMPLSPYLANLYLSDFDSEMIRQKIPMVRYADDLVAFTDCKSQALKIDSLCRQEARKAGLTIHPISDQKDGKTYICPPPSSAEFLGIDIKKTGRGNYKLSVPKHKIDVMRKELSKFKDLNTCSKLGVNMLNIHNILLTKTNGYKAVYENCENFSSLNNSLTDTKREVIKHVYKSVGIDLFSLTNNQKRFLRIEEY